MEQIRKFQFSSLVSRLLDTREYQSDVPPLSTAAMPRRPNVCPHWADGNCRHFGNDHYSCKYQEHPLKYLYSNICHRELRRMQCPEHCRRIHVLTQGVPAHIVRMCREWDSSFMQPPIYRDLPSLPRWLTEPPPPQGTRHEQLPAITCGDTDNDMLPDPAEVLEMLHWWRTHIRGDTRDADIDRPDTFEDEAATSETPGGDFNQPLPTCTTPTS